MGSNNFACTLTDGQITGIRMIDCGLTGSIPSEFAAMSNLQRLHLTNNAINDSIPEYFNQFERFPKLEELYLGFNHLSGTVPLNIFQYQCTPQRFTCICSLNVLSQRTLIRESECNELIDGCHLIDILWSMSFERECPFFGVSALYKLDFQQNKALILDVSHLNLTRTAYFDTKFRIQANFSFLHVHLDNDTDSTLYQLLAMRYSFLSIRSSVNHFAFKWTNLKSSSSRSSPAAEYHSIDVMNRLDLTDNSISGEFPCHFEQVPMELFLADNLITSSNVSCYRHKRLSTLLVFQRKESYSAQTECYGS